jgi:hypothetical protein
VVVSFNRQLTVTTAGKLSANVVHAPEFVPSTSSANKAGNVKLATKMSVGANAFVPKSTPATQSTRSVHACCVSDSFFHTP